MTIIWSRFDYLLILINTARYESKLRFVDNLNIKYLSFKRMTCTRPN